MYCATTPAVLRRARGKGGVATGAVRDCGMQTSLYDDSRTLSEVRWMSYLDRGHCRSRRRSGAAQGSTTPVIPVGSPDRQRGYA